jgi:hypothetical protein
MSGHVRLRRLPERLTTGVLIVNSGLSRRHADDDTAAALHGMATMAYPFLRSETQQRFVRLVCAGDPEMREEGSLRPTRQGMSIAKDVWMCGIGLSLLVDGLGDDGC